MIALFLPIETDTVNVVHEMTMDDDTHILEANKMKLKDMRFKVTDNETGKSYVVGWSDIYGYERGSSESGVFAKISKYSSIRLTSNTIGGFYGVNEDLDIEIVRD